MTHLQTCALAALALSLTVLSPTAPASAQEEAAAEAAPKKANAKAKKKRGKRRGKKRGKAKPRAAAVAPAADASGEDGAADDDAPAATSTAAAPSGSLRRSNKMEFDARLVRGETAGTGAVVLFDRGQRELPSLTEERTGFLDATIREVYRGKRPKQVGDGRRGKSSPAASRKAAHRGNGKAVKGKPKAAAPAAKPTEEAPPADAAPAAEKD